MNPLVFFITLYGLLIISVSISGFILTKEYSILFETFFGLLILIFSYFICKGKKSLYWLCLAITIILSIYFGYNFYQETTFYKASLLGSSVFISFLIIIKVFNIEKS